MNSHTKPPYDFVRRMFVSTAVVFFLLAAAGVARADIDEEILRDFYPQQSLQSVRNAAAATEAPAPRDGTMMFLRVVRNWNQLRPETRSKLSPWFREVESASGARTAAITNSKCVVALQGIEETRASEHFLVHYTTSATSADAVSPTGTANTPDYIRNLLDDAESIRAHEIDTMGFPAPPNGDSGRYDIYVCDLVGNGSSGYLGVTYTDAELTPFIAQSHIELDNDYTHTTIRNGISVREFLDVILAHEYFHAVQFGMNFNYPTSWFLESTATWIEDEVYPNIPDWISQYLPTWFVNPTMSLDHFGSGDVFAYGSAIYFRYLSEKAVGSEGIHALWLLVAEKGKSCSPNCSSSLQFVSEIPEITSLLTSKGLSFATVFQRFGVANYKKTTYRDGSRSIFPAMSPTEVTSTYPNTFNSPSLDHLETNYLRFRPSSTSAPSRLTFSMSGATRATWAVTAVLDRADALYDVRDMTMTGTTGSLIIDGFGTTYTGVVLSVSNLGTTTNADNATYTIIADAASTCGSQQTSASLSSGWNLVSFPITPSAVDPRTLLGAQLTDVYSYNPSAQSLVTFTQSGFKTIGTAGAGYWFNRSAAGTVSMTGCSVTATQADISLSAGWNIFGNPFNTAVDWADGHVAAISDGTNTYSLSQAESNGWLESRVFGFSAGAYAAHPGNSGFALAPWTGYWILAKRALVLRITQ